MPYRIGEELFLDQAVPETEVPISVVTRTRTGLIKTVGVDTEVKKGSKNLLTSGAVYEIIIGGGAAAAIPHASTTVYGIVKIGTGITVVDGVISVAGGGSGTPAGVNTNIQYNNAGAFGANANFVWDISNGRLGVGTPTPTYDIEVVKNAAQVAIRALNTGTGHAGIYLTRTGTPVTDWFITAWTGTTDLRIYNSGGTGTGDVLFITKDKKIGLGVTPAYDLDIQKSDAIQVAARVLNSGAGHAGLYLSRTGASAADWFVSLWNSTTDLRFYGPSGDSFIFTAAKNFGINVTPTYDIDVQKNAVQVAIRALNQGTGHAGIYLSRSGTPVSEWFISAWTGTTDLRIYNSGGTGTGDVLFITKDKRLGLGTSPVYDFDIQKSDSVQVAGRILNSGSGHAGLYLSRTGPASAVWFTALWNSTTDLRFYSPSGIHSLIVYADGRVAAAQAYIRTQHHTGYLEGGWNNIGANDVYSNPIYCIGSNYAPASTTLGSMYGIGFASANVATFLNVFGGGWGMYVAAAGVARIVLDAQYGTVGANNFRTLDYSGSGQDQMAYTDPNGFIRARPMSGTYTPVLTNVQNCPGFSTQLWQWHRVGSVVHIFGEIAMQPGATGTTRLGISIPIASSFPLGTNACGSATAPGVTQAAAIYADGTNARVTVHFNAVVTTNQSYYCHASYWLQ